MIRLSEEKANALWNEITTRLCQIYRLEFILSEIVPRGDTFVGHWEIKTPFNPVPLQFLIQIPRDVVNENWEDFIDYVFYQYEEALVEDFRKRLKNE